MTVDAVGGVWQYACDLSTALRPLGIETVLVLLGPPPSASQREDFGGVTLIEPGLDLDWLAADATAVAAAGVRIAALAEELAADIVHLNQPGLAAAADFSVPVVAAIHSCVATWWQAVNGGEAPAAFAWQTDLVARGLRRATIVVAPSIAFAAQVQRTYALAAPPRVVANGRSMPIETRRDVENSVFTAGRLWDRGKNVALLDRVAARLPCPVRAAGPVQGPNGERISLQHVEAVGALDTAALADRLAGRPVFVSSACYEPFGLAVLEAASAGCALVLADIPTFRDIWGDAAHFVAPDDADGFTAAIARLLDDPALRARSGERARRRAAALTPARTALGMRAIYAEALERHTTRAAVA